VTKKDQTVSLREVRRQGIGGTIQENARNRENTRSGRKGRPERSGQSSGSGISEVVEKDAKKETSCVITNPALFWKGGKADASKGLEEPDQKKEGS